ncbi:hypothetical protein EKK58_08310 [Candidatus Dependentiae bacterium]|nr:MAG: hypothetical protein EKK58_08310 [Candidatus Dependentiae bacterium]
MSKQSILFYSSKVRREYFLLFKKSLGCVTGLHFDSQFHWTTRHSWTREVLEKKYGWTTIAGHGLVAWDDK